MADQKITDLTALTTPDNTDVFPIDDVDAVETKKITWANILASVKSYYDSLTATLTNKTIDGDDNTLQDIATGSLKTKTGVDAAVVTGTAGTSGDLSIWNADGDLVDGPTPPSGAIVGTTDTQTLVGKTISVDDNTVSGIAASSFVLSNGSGNIDGSASQKAIPSGTVVGTSDAQTLTTKRVQPRSVTAASGDISPDLASYNVYQRTALSGGITINAPTGTPVLGEVIVLMIKDNGTSRALTWDSTYTTVPMAAALPTATTISKQLLVTCQYDGTQWLCLSASQT